MKHTLTLITLSLLSIAGLNSCASSSSSAPAEAPAGNDTVLALPLAAAQQSAVRALASIGCDIQKQDPTYVQGRRPNKIGLVVGSGGETIKVWLKSISPTQTGVNVETNKSFVGIAGQKNWDEEVLAAMKR